MIARATEITEAVNAFYEAEPFNLTQSPETAARLIREQNPIRRMYPALDRLLQDPRKRVVFDAGCGTGWFANSVAFHYGAQVEALDLCRAALQFAGAVSAALGVTDRVSLRHGNVFDLPAAGLARDRRFPIVNSLGVLHHTPDCRGAVEQVAHYVAPGGHFHLGLYHLYGRRPFLEQFADVRALEAGHPDRTAREESAFVHYCALYPPSVTDRVMLRSWFRDQVLHPFETQHTVEETREWLIGAGLQPTSTSINDFGPVSDWNAIFRAERTLGDLSFRRNVIERKYYPGFFVVVARRPPAAAGAPFAPSGRETGNS